MQHIGFKHYNLSTDDDHWCNGDLQPIIMRTTDLHRVIMRTTDPHYYRTEYIRANIRNLFLQHLWF